MHTIIHIGAGHAEELDDYLATGAERIVLVEPQPALAEALTAKTKTSKAVTVIEAAIQPKGAGDHLNQFNLQEASSLYPANGLKALFPGLTVDASYPVKTLSPDELLEQYAPSPQDDNLLVLDAPGAEQGILEALINSDTLKAFKHIRLVCPEQPYYESDSYAQPVLDTLIDYGYELQESEHSDPDWPQWQFERNSLKDRIAELEAKLSNAETAKKELATEKEKTTTLEQQLNDATAQVTQQRQRSDETLKSFKAENNRLADELTSKTQTHEQTRTELERANELQSSLTRDIQQARQQIEQQEAKNKELTVTLEAEQTAHEKTKQQLSDNQTWFANRKKQAEELATKLEDATKRIEQLEQERTALHQAGQTQASQYQNLESKIEQLFQQHSQQLHQATNALGQHVTRSFVDQERQVQSYLGLQHYLETGEQPLAFSGWAIGADLATQLAKTLEQSQFDLVIEFGSGTSTVLFAKTILNSLGLARTASQNQALEYENHPKTSRKAIQDHIHDLPRRVLSFEQDKAFHEDTQLALKQAGVDGLVEPVLAPLVPSRHSPNRVNGQEPLFYDCEAKLAQVAQLYTGRTARILILVDGPYSPGSDPTVRAPALGSVLQYLSAHELHLVLDDTNREGEQQVLQHWRELCEQRGLNYSETPWATEKGAVYFTVNP